MGFPQRWQLVVVGWPQWEQFRVMRVDSASSKLIGQEGNETIGQVMRK
jgi:hypothetical protein